MGWIWRTVWYTSRGAGCMMETRAFGWQNPWKSRKLVSFPKLRRPCNKHKCVWKRWFVWWLWNQAQFSFWPFERLEGKKVSFWLSLNAVKKGDFSPVFLMLSGWQAEASWNLWWVCEVQTAGTPKLHHSCKSCVSSQWGIVFSAPGHEGMSGKG